MLESHSSYYPMGERGASPYKWCVRLVLQVGDCKVNHGCIGFDTKCKAQTWLSSSLSAINEGRIFQGSPVVESGIYYAK